VGLERGPLSLVSTTEELLARNSSGSGLESREYGRRVPWCWPRGSLYPKKLGLISPTICGRSGGIVRPQTQATEFSLVLACGKWSGNTSVWKEVHAHAHDCLSDLRLFPHYLQC
jgi:hypothetical protein